MGLSRREYLIANPDAYAAWRGSVTGEQALAAAESWAFNARPEQQWPDGAWRVWLLNAGRGFGKTRTGAEAVREMVEQRGYRRLALVGPTAADVRDVMVEGESGILNVFPEDQRPEYEPSKRRITFANGAIATCYSADKPDRLRGPQHDGFWADEIAAWQYADAWDQLMFGLRLGNDPRGVATTTPRPKTLIRELLSAPTTHVTHGSTYDNAANLAGAFLDTILAKYEGTTLGRQELYAELLDESPGALWTRATLQANRVERMPAGVEVVRMVVAIDPAVTNSANSDETGIIVACLGSDGHAYVLEDCSLRNTPMAWAQAGIDAYSRWNADRMVGEVNNGGDLVETVVRQLDDAVSYKPVRASHGKYARAEPVAALYEQGRVHHVGLFATLEDEQTNWTPDIGWSPNHMDALVWAISELMLGPSGTPAAAASPLEASAQGPAVRDASGRRLKRHDA